MRKIDTLKKNYEFKNVLDKGKFYRGKYITIYISKNKKEIPKDSQANQARLYGSSRKQS